MGVIIMTNTIIPKHIKLITDQLSDASRPIVFEDMSLEDWENSGRPYVIQLVEQYDNAYCYLDSGYGSIFLIIEDEIKGDKIARGRNICVVDNIIAVDKQCFSVESYIFKGYSNHD